jgi:hypothetical protein
VALDVVVVDSADVSDAEVGELLDQDRASSSGSDNADVQVSQERLAGGAEQSDLAIEALGVRSGESPWAGRGPQELDVRADDA